MSGYPHQTPVAPDDSLTGPWIQSIRLAFGFLFVAVGVLAVLWLASNIRSVPPDARAAVLRFGSLDRVAGSGLLLAWPQPFEEVVLLPSPDRSLGMRVDRLDQAPPFRAQTAQAFPVSTDPRANIAFFLTGDASVAHLTADIFYRVTDPAAYLLAREGLDGLLQRLAIAGAVTIAAERSLDGILVTGMQAKLSASLDQLRTDLAREVNRRLAELAADDAGVGIEVTRVDLASDLPSIAKAAFDQVLVATQAADSAIAEANTEAETWRQKAYQDADKIRYDAQAAAEEALSRARARTAEANALADQTGSPSVLDHIYFERIAKILSKAHRVDVFDPAGASRLILPGATP